MNAIRLSLLFLVRLVPSRRTNFARELLGDRTINESPALSGFLEDGFTLLKRELQHLCTDMRVKPTEQWHSLKKFKNFIKIQEFLKFLKYESVNKKGFMEILTDYFSDILSRINEFRKVYFCSECTN